MNIPAIDINSFLVWLFTTTGATTVVLGVLAYVFREKWKQILQRSVVEDVERLKAELARESAVHAASLAPKIEGVKHEFQERLENYKVMLIAQAEEAKAKSQLKASIAIKFAEIEFNRLIELERRLSYAGSPTLAAASYPLNIRVLEQGADCLKASSEFGAALDAANMFLEPNISRRLSALNVTLLTIVNKYVGPHRPVMPANEIKDAMNEIVGVLTIVRDKIKKVAAL